MVDDSSKTLNVRFAYAGSSHTDVVAAIGNAAGFTVSESAGSATWQFNTTHSVNLYPPLYPPHVFFSNDSTACRDVSGGATAGRRQQRPAGDYARIRQRTTTTRMTRHTSRRS